MSTGSVDLSALPTICQAGPNFLRLTGFFSSFLRTYFANGDNFALPSWRGRVWTSDLKTTNLVIDDATLYNPKQVEHRPSLLVRRNSFSSVSLGIDSGRAMGAVSLTGERHYTNIWKGSHTVFCLARLPGETEQLAFETWFALNSYAPAIRLIFGLVACAVAEIGPLGILKESAGQQWVVPITIAYAVQENWTLKPQSPPATQTGMDVTIE
jgi:hypothetical protein